MLKRFGWAALLLASLGFVACAGESSDEDEEVGSAAAAVKGGKVMICHIPPGNPANAHEISVSSSALAAHLAHGDTVGECGGGCGLIDDTCGSGSAACCDGLVCNDGACGKPIARCSQVSSLCKADNECCTGSCFDGVCVAINVCIAQDVIGCSPAMPCCGGDHCAFGFCYPDDVFQCDLPGTPMAFGCCWGLDSSNGFCQ